MQHKIKQNLKGESKTNRKIKQKEKKNNKNNTNINQQTIKKLKIIESKNNGKYNTYHGPLSQKWIDGRYRSSIFYALLTQVMSNLLPGFRVVLESIHNNP